MAQFTITLPDNLMATVRKGKMMKINYSMSDLLKFKKAKKEERVGYVVNIDLAPGDRIVYQLSKTPDGKWLSHTTDAMTEAVRHAIDSYEIHLADQMPERL